MISTTNRLIKMYYKMAKCITSFFDIYFYKDMLIYESIYL